MHNGFNIDVLLDALAERTVSTARPQDDLLTPDEVARKLGGTVSLLGRWRANGKGLPWIGLGARKVVAG